MEIAGYLASAFIGFSLGLIGGGGSILTVPILVYLFSIPPGIATAYSLFIVGFTSLAGAYTNYRRGLVNFNIVILFGSSSFITVFSTRKFIIPALPVTFFTIGAFKVTHALFVMVVFALLMVTASLSMIRNRPVHAGSKNEKKPAMLVIYGIFIGLVTGLLGAGGGFLLIPALVMLMKLPMKEAIGTSLPIIALNSLIGFAGDIGHQPMNWNLLLAITAIAVTGLFIGIYMNKRVNNKILKKGFGWFVLAMGICVLMKEIFSNR